MKSSSYAFWAMSIAPALISANALAQTSSGTIVGRVEDPTGQSVPAGAANPDQPVNRREP
jgi:hypothetical protein